MALNTPAKTNWTSNDGVRMTEINAIELNLQALEDSKYEEGDNVILGDITGEDLAVESVTTSGAILPTTSPTSDTEVISSTSAWVIPRGVYNISLQNTPVSSGVNLEIYVDGNWRVMASRSNTGSEEESYGSTIFSDGNNARVNNGSSASYTVYYQKF